MRPRLLFLCHTLPYPPDGGPWIRTYHVLRLLARAFDITALCFERAATAGRGVGWDEAITALGRFAQVEVFSIPQRHSPIRLLWDHARSVACRRVYTTYLFRSRAFHRRVRDLLDTGDFSMVHVDSLDLCDYLHECHGLPIACVHHDVQSALLARRAGVDGSTWRSLYLRYQSALMEREERQWAARVGMNVAVSDRDGALIKQLAPEARVITVPNGVDVDEFRPVDVAGGGVAFAGGAIAFPNPDALEFFCADILPHLRAADRDLPARWIGRATPEQQRHYAVEHGVELTGYVKDVRPLMAAATCHIVPLRAGGGTRLKILNSWAMGKPIVSTAVGCEGLAAVDDDNILIRDDPKAFAEAVLGVLHDASLRQRLGRRGRETVESLYSWDAIAPAMLDSYLSVANVKSRRLVPASAA